ncbi:DUF4249 domain-containing protein [Fulvivirgaceae bacterium BMA10]|uniref:DUF4249 domain-containing protein n=1 Tax=Splendidivirga corallicola TaxID=3051826 RepID=A0ABT8KK10_9BACT|nr:DUF4249 domain-containing protein [Fulvivirgaceae bacterium BMA10]
MKYKEMTSTINKTKRLILKLTVLSLLSIHFGCEDEITPNLDDAPSVMVVDAWLTNQEGPQTIRLTMSQPYFNNSQLVGVQNAVVSVIDNENNEFTFAEQENGEYVWQPFNGEALGEIGNAFTLRVEHDGETYEASSVMNRVPPIDSVTFTFEEAEFGFPDRYSASFWARDPEGLGDTYWIKTYKNGEFLSKPSELVIAFDAGFRGGNTDGLIFIPPIREAINPLDEDGDGGFLAPYANNDSVYVELHSITEEAYQFLTEVQIQTNRPGGFAELFSQPLSNVPSNIRNMTTGSNKKVVGFFNVAAVSGNGTRLDTSQISRN